MNDSKISVRYSKALFGLAKERAVLEEVQQNMQLISQLLISVPEFKKMLESPVVRSSEKRSVIQNILGERIHPLTLSFLDLLLTNKREEFLQIIARNFMTSCRELSGIKQAQLTSAHELDEETLRYFDEVIRKYFKTKVELSCKVNEKLIGGFILRVEDLQIDASVNTKIEKLRRELLKAN